MKIKIIEPGWAGFTGDFGMVDFVDGVSVDDVSRVEAARLGGLVAIETLEGVNPSASQILLDAHSAPAKVVTLVHIPDTAPEGKVFTAEELGEVADKGGIKAIRAISDPMGLKDNSITELIAKILAHQAEKAKASA